MYIFMINMALTSFHSVLRSLNQKAEALSLIRFIYTNSINRLSHKGPIIERLDLSDLPIIYRTPKGQQIQFDWMKEESLPDAYDMIQRVGEDSNGFEPDAFHPFEKFRSILLPCIRRQQAIQMVDMDIKKLVGMFHAHASPLCRSASPIMNGGYIIIDHGYQGRVGNFGFNSFYEVASKGGYLGLTARAGARNPPSYVGSVRLGCVLPAYIPQNCNTPKHGWTDDLCIHGMYTSDTNHKLFQMSEDEAITRALEATKPKLEPRSYPSLDRNCTFPDGKTARIHSSSLPGDIEKAFNVLSEAAYNAESFAIDEFPTLFLFENNFLYGNQLILIDIGEDKNVGVGVLGECRMRRNKGTPNALIYVYLTSRYRGKGCGKLLMSELENHAIECGFSACLLDALVTKDLPYKFLRDLGYINTGSIPLSGYVKGQGWTDALLFYKNFRNNLYDFLEYDSAE